MRQEMAGGCLWRVVRCTAEGASLIGPACHSRDGAQVSGRAEANPRLVQASRAYLMAGAPRWFAADTAQGGAVGRSVRPPCAMPPRAASVAKPVQVADRLHGQIVVGWHRRRRGGWCRHVALAFPQVRQRDPWRPRAPPRQGDADQQAPNGLGPCADSPSSTCPSRAAARLRHPSRHAPPHAAGADCRMRPKARIAVLSMAPFPCRRRPTTVIAGRAWPVGYTALGVPRCGAVRSLSCGLEGGILSGSRPEPAFRNRLGVNRDVWDQGQGD